MLSVKKLLVSRKIRIGNQSISIVPLNIVSQKVPEKFQTFAQLVFQTRAFPKKKI